MIIGVVEDNKIINVIVFDDLVTAEEMFPTQELLDLNDPVTTYGLNLGINWYKENNIWYPPKPSEDCVWVEDLYSWLSPQDHENYLKFLSEQ
jgi:hypothetical protein